MKGVYVPILPKPGQENYAKALQEKEIVFVSGHAGSGKTILALNQALKCLNDRSNPIEKICIIRPYVFTKTEKLGALPGSLQDKIHPFAESITDNLEELLDNKSDVNFIIKNKMEFLTLSTLRGRSLHKRYIIVEESQNIFNEGDGVLTILTRLGQNSRIVLAGDLSQSDISKDESGFLEAVNALSDLPEVAYIEMNDVQYIYRNKLIGKIITAFNKFRNNYE